MSEKDESSKGALVGLAVAAGLAAIAAAVTDALERRERIKKNLEQMKDGKGKGPLWERQESFESGVSKFVEAQHQHFQGALETSEAAFRNVLRSELAQVHERLDAIAKAKEVESPPLPGYPLSGDKN